MRNVQNSSRILHIKVGESVSSLAATAAARTAAPGPLIPLNASFCMLCLAALPFADVVALVLVKKCQNSIVSPSCPSPLCPLSPLVK